MQNKRKEVMMNSEWKIVRLEDIGRIVTGNTPKTSIVSNYESKDVSFYKPSDFNDDVKIMLDAESKVSLSALIGARVLPKNAIMVSCIGTIGKIGITAFDCISNQQINAIIPNTNIDSKFVAYSLLSNRDRLRSIANAPIVPIINKTSFSNFSIRITDLEKQQEIAGILDKASELVEKRKAQLAELDTLAESVFYDMFGDPVTNEKGWEMPLIKDISTVKIGPFGSLLHVEDYISGGVPLVNPVHMKGLRVVADDNLSVTKEKYDELKSYILKPNDIIFGRRGDIGRCALITDSEDGYICGTGSLFIRFKKSVNPQYSICALSHKSISNYLKERAKGATMLNINCKIIENMPMVYPPLNLQAQFAERIEKIEQQKEQVRKGLKESEDLFQRLMQDLFNPN